MNVYYYYPVPGIPVPGTPGTCTLYCSLYTQYSRQESKSKSKSKKKKNLTNREKVTDSRLHVNRIIKHDNKLFQIF